MNYLLNEDIGDAKFTSNFSYISIEFKKAVGMSNINDCKDIFEANSINELGSLARGFLY